MKLHRSNTCPQSNLNWVMVLHHVTVPRQLTGGPLLCVRGVTCHMIDDTTGVQGLRLIASLNHFVWRSADGLAAARAPACPRTQDTCIQTQAMLERQTKHTLTIARTTAAASCSSRSPVGSPEVQSREAGIAGRSLPDWNRSVAGSAPVHCLWLSCQSLQKQINKMNELSHTKTILAAVIVALRSFLLSWTWASKWLIPD